MINVETVIKNKAGLHARPASLIAETAQKFESEVELEGNGNRVNAKSIIDIMLLAAENGSKINIYAKGNDEEKAVSAILELFEKKFDEE
jgi:phosphocarrier protein HPr